MRQRHNQCVPRESHVQGGNGVWYKIDWVTGVSACWMRGTGVPMFSRSFEVDFRKVEQTNHLTTR